MSSIKMFKFKAFVVTGVASLGAISAQPAQAITGFTGPYAPANWTNGSTYGGSVDTSGAPGSIILKIPPVADFFTLESASYSITSPGSGQVSFDWSASVAEAYLDFFLNGVPYQVANPGGISGSDSYTVSIGDTFAFTTSSYDDRRPYDVLISNFSAPSAPTPPAGVPGPLPLFGAGAAYGWSRRLRRRLSNPQAQAKAIPTIA